MFSFAATLPPGADTQSWSDWLGRIFKHWVAQDCLVFLVLVGLALGGYLLLRREHWRAAFRHLLKSKIAVICSFICGLFCLIAGLDSIYFPAQTMDGNTPKLDAKNQPIYEDPYHCSSLLDRLLPMRRKVERTYSAPLAGVEFTLTTNETTRLREQKPLQHPGTHWLGTDQVGQDVLYKCIKGVRTGVLLGLLATLLASLAATFFGIVAGYFGGWIDDLIQYVYTTIGSIPDILLIIAFVQVFGRGLFQLCVIMGVTSWVGLCRLLRGETMKLREMEYIQAAKALGVPWYKILLTHILPNVLHIILISLVLRFSGLVLAEAVLAYIGVGLDPSASSWGNMINSAKEELSRDPIVWWILLGSFVSMLALIFPANLLGDQVRDALDPKLRKGEE